MLSSDATFSMEMLSFGHCPEEMVTYLRDHELDNVKTGGGGSGNRGGKRLAISMVEGAWLSEKEERKDVFVEEKECFIEEKECFRLREKDVFFNEKMRAF
nr:hypothetical protein [Tanacetum cinerariifolium]